MSSDFSPGNNERETSVAAAPAPTLQPGRAAAAPLQSHKVTEWQRARLVAGYLAAKDRRILLVIVSLVTVLCLIGVWRDGRLSMWEALSVISSVSAFAMAWAIFLSEAAEHMETRLPKRLSVYFLDPDDDTPRLACKFAPLSSEADVRAWGQQIARQISGGHDLHFAPFVNLRRLGLEKLDGAPFIHYQAIFRFQQLPDGLLSELRAQEEQQRFPVAKTFRAKPGDPYGAETGFEYVENCRPVA